MKLLQSWGPNPRTVRMFLLEKGIELPMETIDILGAENRGAEFKKKNPAAQIPALVLDDGFVLGETVAIAQYLEELNPAPSLLGTSARERAETQMWVRRIEFGAIFYMEEGFRYAEGLELMKGRARCLPEAAAGLKAKGQDGLQMLDGTLAGKTWVCGDRFSLADIVLYTNLDFCTSAGQPLDPDHKNLGAWFERIGKRPTAEASIDPLSAQIAMRG